MGSDFITRVLQNASNADQFHNIRCDVFLETLWARFTCDVEDQAFTDRTGNVLLQAQMKMFRAYVCLIL